MLTTVGGHGNINIMRSAINNPFSPGSDIVPPIWAGRVEQMADWDEVVKKRRTSGVYERGRVFLGEAGIGKSTLVQRIIESDPTSWATPQIRIPHGTDALKVIAESLLDLANQAGISKKRKLKALLTRVTEVSMYGIALTFKKSEGMEPYRALYMLLLELGRAAMARGRVVIIHIDEVQNITDIGMLSQLLIALGDAITYREEVPAFSDLATVKRVLPITIYLTGLPDFSEMAGADKGATFSRRFKTETLAPLAFPDLEMALQPFLTEGWSTPEGRVGMTPGAAQLIIDLCKGDPYLFQLCGEKAWYAGSSNLITEDDVTRGWASATSEITSHVERILRRIPKGERHLIDAMISLAKTERTATKIAEAMGKRGPNEIGSTAQRLDDVRGIISRGKPYTFRHKAIEAYLSSEWPLPPGNGLS